MQISFVPFLRVSQLVASNFTVLAVPCFSGSLTTVNSPFAALPSSFESSAAREEVKRIPAAVTASINATTVSTGRRR